MPRRDSDTGRPLVGGEDEGHGTVVLDHHAHVSTKAARPRLYSALANALHEDLVHLLGAGRIAGLEQARAAAPAHVGEERELRHDQSRAPYVDQAPVHLPRLI